MSAGWFKLPGFWSAKMGPRKVYSEFAILSCCCPGQLLVQVSTVEPFLRMWTGAMGDWGPSDTQHHHKRVLLVLVRAYDLYKSYSPSVTCKWFGFNGLLSQRHGKAGDERERVKAFINKTWGRFKKSVILKKMKIWRSVRAAPLVANSYMKKFWDHPCWLLHVLFP